LIQQAFRIRGISSLNVSISNLRMVEDGDGFVLLGQWEGQGLAQARREVADVLGQLPDESEALDMLLGIKDSVARWADALREEPNIQNSYRFETLEWQGLTFLRLLGMSQFGEPDVLVEVEPDIEESQVIELLGDIGRYRLQSARGLGPGEAIPFGYWLLSIASEGLYPNFPTRPTAEDFASNYAVVEREGLTFRPPNFLIEAKDPERIGEDDWVVGASQALRVLAVQRATHERLGKMLGCDTPPCHPAFSGDPVVLCSRASGNDEFFGLRMPLGADGESGWQFGCHDPDHAHDETTMVFGVLSQLTLSDPRIIQYLALPTGWSFSKEADGFWVNGPGDERSFKDEGSDSRLPWCRVENL
jgi:hypothetical protein